MTENYSKFFLPSNFKKKIILSGANGYVGQELASQLALNNIKYLGIDKRESKKFNHLQIELNSKQALTKMAAYNPDLFIHAGTHSAQAYKENLNKSFDDDYQSLLTILKALKNKQTKMVYFSSSYVYSGIKDSEIVTEETILSPEHNFGLAKGFFEQLILRNRPNSIIFRLSSVFGGQNSINPNFITSMTEDARDKNHLIVWGKGKRKMQYIYIEEVIKVILQSFDFKPGIYNLGGNDYNTVHKTAKQIAGFFNSKLTMLEDKQEGMTLPFMNNNKLLSSSKDIIKNNQKFYLSQYLETQKKTNEKNSK
jgi:nucleoside-diphosphate-sugar epimerase